MAAAYHDVVPFDGMWIVNLLLRDHYHITVVSSSSVGYE